MALFQLDPQSIAARIRASGAKPKPMSLASSVGIGIFGFITVSVIGIMPWPICEFWVRGASERQMHIACTLAFVAVSGVCLHKLILGPGSLSRFYKLFAIAFPAFAACWVGFWTWRPDPVGVAVGLVTGTIAMGSVIAFAFGAPSALAKFAAPHLVFNAAGYYAAQWCEGFFTFERRFPGMMIWAVCFGIGFGAGLGIAFYFSQEKVRAALAG